MSNSTTISGTEIKKSRYPDQSEVVAKRSIATTTALLWLCPEIRAVPTDIAIANAANAKPKSNALKDNIN